MVLLVSIVRTDTRMALSGRYGPERIGCPLRAFSPLMEKIP